MKYKILFAIALSVFCLYLLKIWTMVAYIESFRATGCLWWKITAARHGQK
jgi:hypothetical protein